MSANLPEAMIREAGPGLGNLAGDDRLRSVVDATFRAHGLPVLAAPDVSRAAPAAPFWPATFFELERLSAFRGASPDAQDAIVRTCGDDLLQEALHIETIGMAFSSRMVLLSDTVEERSLHALFAGEEAAHLAGLSRFGARRPSQNPFLALLAELVAAGDRPSLVLVVQVVLEGWGLDHYRRLARASTDVALTEVLDGIVRDEARHHGSGLLAAPRLGSTDASVEVLTQFLAMVQAGPQGVVAAVETHAGALARADRLRAFTELDTETHAGRRLALVRELLLRAGADGVVTALASRGCFRPLSAEEVA